MRILITAGELLDKGLWEKYCDITGTNIWAINEGLINSNDELDLTESVSIQLGLIGEQ